MEQSASETIGDYRRILALNNVGVSFVEKGCLRQGMRTLKEAVTLMKAMHRRSAFCVRLEVDRKLRRAHEALSTSKVGVKPPRLEIVEYEDSLIQCNAMPVGCLRAVRIELQGLAPDRWLTDRNLATDFALLLNNFGIASYLLFSKKQGSGGKNLLRTAQRAFKLAVASITSSFSSCESLLDEAIMTTIVLLFAFNLSQVHMETGRSGDATALYEKCHSIRQLMHRVESAGWIILLQGNSPATAPAA